jgi:hypothetical protein
MQYVRSCLSIVFDSPFYLLMSRTLESASKELVLKWGRLQDQEWSGYRRLRKDSKRSDLTYGYRKTQSLYVANLLYWTIHLFAALYFGF